MITGMSNSLLLFECESYNTEYPLPVEQIKIQDCGADGKELTQLLTHFPKLTELLVTRCEKITELGMVELQMEMATPSSPGSEIETEHAQAGHHQTREEVEEAVAGGEGLLLLPRRLEELRVYQCKELLSSRPIRPPPYLVPPCKTSVCMAWRAWRRWLPSQISSLLPVYSCIITPLFLPYQIKLWGERRGGALHRGARGGPSPPQFSPDISSLPKDGLPSSLQELEIKDCPAIKSLPRDGLSSSLRKLETTKANPRGLLGSVHSSSLALLIQFSLYPRTEGLWHEVVEVLLSLKFFAYTSSSDAMALGGISYINMGSVLDLHILMDLEISHLLGLCQLVNSSILEELSAFTHCASAVALGGISSMYKIRIILELQVKETYLKSLTRNCCGEYAIRPIPFTLICAGVANRLKLRLQESTLAKATAASSAISPAITPRPPDPSSSSGQSTDAQIEPSADRGPSPVAADSRRRRLALRLPDVRSFASQTSTRLGRGEAHARQARRHDDLTMAAEERRLAVPLQVLTASPRPR
ncbi:hypothetical protein ZWY2020_058949 [Hordeum vulgare]|nr:hypothetical protein ZWY2020_058949 [Hordeum vulgare]